MSAPVRVALVTPNFENNSLGRTWCLWALSRALGWRTEVVGVKGSALWAPLAGSPFADDCVVPASADRAAALPAVRAAIGRADLVIAVKPLVPSLGVALAERDGTPLLADVDDPDVEVRTTWRPPLERLRRPGFLPSRRAVTALGAAVREVPRIVSNPVLQRMYGGEVIPHVRAAGPEPTWAERDEPVVRFVGSVRGHKGVDVLRVAAARAGVALEVTAAPPSDASAGERWLGTTTLAEGEALVRGADVVAVPSLPTLWTPAQLPAKLVDAMIAGRAIVASAAEPVVWALGGTGMTVPPGEVEALAEAIRGLRDPVRRRELGAAARERALERFTIDAVAPAFERAAHAAMTTAVPA
ncbi:glycosyltransferase family 4 protein [Amnibacterium endophyticum]|uniref:Glycosyltransferase family 4 protein n=1 Tax=Amnibacterium endophyticum TaxID=2109337 RepID=A0ABW4LCM4_9MICO